MSKAITRPNDYGYGGAYYANLPKANAIYISEERGEQRKRRRVGRFADRVTPRDKAMLRCAVLNRSLPAYKIADLLGISRPTLSAMLGETGTDIRNFSREKFFLLADYLGLVEEMDCLREVEP